MIPESYNQSFLKNNYLKHQTYLFSIALSQFHLRKLFPCKLPTFSLLYLYLALMLFQILSCDSVTVSVDAVVYFNVIDAELALCSVDDFR